MPGRRLAGQTATAGPEGRPPPGGGRRPVHPVHAADPVRHRRAAAHQGRAAPGRHLRPGRAAAPQRPARSARRFGGRAAAAFRRGQGPGRPRGLPGRAPVPPARTQAGAGAAARAALGGGPARDRHAGLPPRPPPPQRLPDRPCGRAGIFDQPAAAPGHAGPGPAWRAAQDRVTAGGRAAARSADRAAPGRHPVPCARPEGAQRSPTGPCRPAVDAALPQELVDRSGAHALSAEGRGRGLGAHRAARTGGQLRPERPARSERVRPLHRVQGHFGEALAQPPAQPPDTALLDGPVLLHAGQQLRGQTPQRGLVAADQHRLVGLGPAGRLDVGADGRVRRQRRHDAHLAAQGFGGLAAAQRGAHQHPGRRRQPVVEPGRHAARLTLALGRQRTLQVILTRRDDFGFGVAPQDQVHGRPFIRSSAASAPAGR
mmetsp:Transcript_24633/g.58178  ORF Transcript_24633/g.58178 Transcript_24633/m.58178 type:complete len:429 (+) Transcript_24633:1326-2612(+)